MSIQAVGWVLEQKLPARPKLVLVAIANHANHVDGYCWLKVETIAAEAACSPRAVHNFLGDLIRNGFIRKAARRGDDGKQRANDYWILLDRDPGLEWVKTGDVSQDDDDSELIDDARDPQDVGIQTAQNAGGRDDENAPPEAVEKPARAVGPTAPACSHIESAEPSKIKPEEDARARSFTPRSYRPPPPPKPRPVGEVIGRKAEQIFVFLGTPAYDAWAQRMANQNRVSRWQCLTTLVVNGEKRSGWYFPSLFPPSAHADPPQESEEAS